MAHTSHRILGTHPGPSPGEPVSGDREATEAPLRGRVHPWVGVPQVTQPAGMKRDFTEPGSLVPKDS